MRHLTKTVMSYPPGHVPSGWDAPEGYVPEGSIEDYDLALAEEAPVVGQEFDRYGQRWAIARVQTYRPVDQFETALEAFHVAICTLDGSVPNREPWHDGNAPLMVVHAVAGGLVLDENDNPCWELVEREEWISPAEGMALEQLQHFEPVGARCSRSGHGPTPGDYSRVIVAWSANAVALDEREHQAAA